jgi:short-subunit dehydrogenase
VTDLDCRGAASSTPPPASAASTSSSRMPERPSSARRRGRPFDLGAELEINFHGVWRTARIALPYLIERRGYLMNIASIAAIVPFPGASAYAASKAAVEAFSNSLRLEVAHLGVEVGVAYFSFISTPLVQGFEERAAFRTLRASAPPLLRNTYPVELAAEALVRGIAERSRRVYAPGWLRWLLLARGLLSNRWAERSLRRGAPGVPRARRPEPVQAHERLRLPKTMSP